MKLRLLFLALIIMINASFDVSACYRAYQYRLFPIGVSDSGLVVIEIELIRNLRWGDRWEGSLSLKRIDGDKELNLYKRYDSLTIWDSVYSEQLMPYFNEFFGIANQLNNFIKGETPEIEYCMYQKKGKLIGLSVGKNNALKIKVKRNKKSFHIPFPKQVLKESQFIGTIEHQPFNLQSVRIMKIAGKDYIIANIATGEYESTYNIKQYKKIMKFDSIEKCIYKELTLYHGLCFDAILPL